LLSQINLEDDEGPGEIYFVREKDVISGHVSSYVKIGLVRAADDRDSEDRLREHQTGNPRNLSLHGIVRTFSVSTAEGMMHRKLAVKRVSGEWFNLSDGELGDAIAMCKTFAMSAEEHESRLIQVAALENTESKAELTDATEEALKWVKILIEALAVISSCEKLAASFNALTVSARDRGEETIAIAKVQTRKGTEKFDEVGFKNEFPELHAQFEESKESIKKTFTLSNKKSYNLDIAQIHPELFTLQQRFGELEAKVVSEEQAVASLQGIYLNVLGILKEASWDKEVAQTHLKIICGHAAGINDVCKWSRVRKVTVSINKKALKSAYAAEYVKHVIVSATKEILELKKGGGSAAGDDLEND
jgi:hypothetical protein